MQVFPPGLAVTVYPVTDEPPSKTGGATATIAEALPATARLMLGALGTVNGVAVAVAEAGPEPAEFAEATESV